MFIVYAFYILTSFISIPIIERNTMNFDFSEEQILLKKTVRDFAEAEIAPQAMELDKKEEFSYDLTEKMGELGLFGICVSPEYGGMGMDILSYILAVEEISRIDASQAATIVAAWINALTGVGPSIASGNHT